MSRIQNLVYPFGPNAPFTNSDVEIMRSLRIRETKKKYRLMLFIMFILEVSIIIVGLYTFTSARRKGGYSGYNFGAFVLAYFVLTVGVLVATYVIVVTYKRTLNIIKDPNTNPEIILSGNLNGAEKKLKRANRNSYFQDECFDKTFFTPGQKRPTFSSGFDDKGESGSIFDSKTQYPDSAHLKDKYAAIELDSFSKLQEPPRAYQEINKESIKTSY
ncbi:hypothetical protein AX774_g143 [Zancudomyces culisetae]|uniref:Uncharacterized protein n=1 Tax=Zancudomyces culisetae TaxID=1213189 RepID=A0A1R1PZ62_ZANCU|nr:hypothetical protein AX774_g143 [Zancudomyces culisetae]|eukprot:OMH86252.1 hypothetical protein AX774_g143 [Zancudomyces culisetae]